jgi:superfamily II DNA or RNA helicase
MPLTFSAGTLVLTVPQQAAGRTPWSMPGWVWDRRAGVWRCDAIHYGEIARRLAAGEGRCDDRVPQWQPVSWPKVALPELRPDQLQACAAWRKTERGVIVMPTGTGKTEVALAIMRDTGVSTLVVSPVRDLMYQWHRRILRGLGYDAGIIGDSVYRVSPVSVTTYDSACIHMERLGATFGLIVFDECHHLPGDVRRDAARMSAAPRRLGLTATPERSDGKHADLDELIGPVVFQQSISSARGTTLAEYDVVRIPIHLSDDEQRRYDELSAQVRRFMIEKRNELSSPRANSALKSDVEHVSNVPAPEETGHAEYVAWTPRPSESHLEADGRGVHPYRERNAWETTIV